MECKEWCVYISQNVAKTLRCIIKKQLCETLDPRCQLDVSICCLRLRRIFDGYLTINFLCHKRKVFVQTVQLFYIELSRSGNINNILIFPMGDKFFWL